MNATPSTCPSCLKQGVITPYVVMGITFYHFACSNWACGKKTNLTEAQAAAWLAEEKTQ